MAMQQISTISALRTQRQLWRDSNQRVAFVPTMGNLHSGHLKLVRQAQTVADRVVVSIYVNPLQFGANEDLDAYPRTLQADLDALQALDVDAVFTPANEDIYPRGLAAQTFIEVPDISELLCGASRPGHFRGVATIVCKLFNMVQPDVALFGKKDFQQLQVIRLMVADLSLPVDIIGVDTEREESGLAKSSRNGYLSAAEKATAAVIYQVLQHSTQRLADGDSNFLSLEAEGEKCLRDAGLQPEYVSIRDKRTLQKPLNTTHSEYLIVLIAARLGNTRLIDNMEVSPTAS